MKRILNISQFQEWILLWLKSVFNKDKLSRMSTICVKVERQKSPFDHLQRK